MNAEMLIYALSGLLFILMLMVIIVLHRKNVRFEQRNSELIQENAKITTQLAHEKQRVEDMKAVREELGLTFKNISHEILKEQKKDFGEAQKLTFDAHITPLKSEIQSFKTQIAEMNKEHLVGRTSLSEQLKQFEKMNLSLQKEAAELANALKGNKKLQGNWGEIQLEKLFEITGLKENINYQKQESSQTDEGRKIPDYILTLPDNRQVIIDAKVSLNHYMQYINTEDPDEKEQSLRQYIADIRNHIKRLSSKEYAKLLQAQSLDFVFMFMPLEHAYIEALQCEPRLYENAYQNNVAITTPSSLLPVLRTIELLWKIEKRHKNVERIADLGGQLYDKLVNFSESMVNMGTHLGRAQQAYDEALKRLKDGRGNAIQTAEKLRELGANTSKTFDVQLIEDAPARSISAPDAGELFPE